MVEKKIYIGSVGPFLFDDDDPIDDPDGDFTGVHQKALVSDKQMMITETPSADEHVLRLQDLAGRVLAPVVVSDINDPSTELGALSGAPGVLVVVYQVNADEDESTLYSWDSAVSTGVNVPFVVAGSSGFWIARSGKYSNDQGVYKTITGDDGSTTADKSNDSLAIEGGSGIETEVTEDKVTINAATLKETQAYTESPMIVSGGEVTEGTNAGTFKVAALAALLRTTDSLTGKLEKVTKTAEDNISITAADTTYFVCLNYNGGSPTISLSTSNPYDADKRSIPIGKVRKDSSNTVHYISGGFRFQDGIEKLHQRAKELRDLELERGSTISYLATDKFTMETGVAYGGINRFTLSAYNSDTTQFTMIYSDGGTGWTETDRNTIDCSHYDDGSGTLATIGNNKYGCHYVYKHIDDDHVYVVLGTGSYSLAEAVVNSVIPPERPAHLDDFGCLIGCIIAPKNGGEFTKIVMVTSQFFSGEEVANHANLSNLDYASSGHTGFAKSVDMQELTDGANISWNMNSGEFAYVTLGGNRTLDNPTNVKAGGNYKLKVIQDGTGGRTLSYGTNFKFSGGTAPTLSSGAGDIDLLEFVAYSSSELYLTNFTSDIQ